jgi:hypothetical protein
METTALLQLPINPESNVEDRVDRREHTRQILYGILKERGVNVNSVTGEKIDEKSDIDTLLQVIQIEKVKNKKQSEISQVTSSTNKPAGAWSQKYDYIGEFWGLTYELYKSWFLCLVLSPLATWLGFLMYNEK